MKRLLMVIAIVFLYAPLVFGLPGVKQWKAIWDANTEADLAGYYFYWRAGSEVFDDTRRVDCGLNTEYNLDSIPNSNYLALTAYDTSENEAGFSNEVFFDKDSIAPAVVDGLSIVEQ